ncbi:MAG: tRNA (guanosine(46)-N7)-methyltransferase TrmB [Deltaproteobacteria bacterium]|nr:tRNA (guanosine(46)-N7)-methyltransferase TrmB [Deltaproteobacteria bacterium]MCB9788716.1 tRNA (guanosine(46)-N7)-methyltransferase TrmB [Deltaproteobacteria bacterium]
MGARNASHVGLVGGSLEERLQHSRVPPIESAWVLAPLRREGDEERLREFVAPGGVHLEIGFGRSHHLADLARHFPDAPVLGFETRRAWCRMAARRAEREGLSHLRVIEGDARPYLDAWVPDGSLAACYILFPDPWWKKRHHKRRLFVPEFVERIHALLAPGGALVAKTDVPAYADLIESTVLDHAGFSLAGTTADDSALEALPRSHREKKCLELGIPYSAFRFVKEPLR